MWNCSSSCLHVRIESGGKEVYHPKAGPVRDCAKNLTHNGSDAETMPSCAKYRLTCSIELAPSDPLNFVKSGSRYLGGSGIRSYSLGYGLELPIAFLFGKMPNWSLKIVLICSMVWFAGVELSRLVPVAYLASHACLSASASKLPPAAPWSARAELLQSGTYVHIYPCGISLGGSYRN